MIALICFRRKPRNTLHVIKRDGKLTTYPVVRPGEKLQWETNDPALHFWVKFKHPGTCKCGSAVMEGYKGHPVNCTVADVFPEDSPAYYSLTDYEPNASDVPPPPIIFWICKNCPTP